MKIIITEDQRDSMREDLRDLTNDLGLVTALKAVGGVRNYIKILYDGDISQYFKETGVPPIRISSEPNLYIDDLIVQKLNLPSIRFIGKDMKDLGEFTWDSSGTYKFHAQLMPMILNSGQKIWRVVGQSGDYGFGYSFITKKNTLGKRARRQIFQQVIDKYGLNSYVWG
jgi:hypothetical protein